MQAHTAAERAVQEQFNCPSLTAERERWLLNAARNATAEQERHAALAELWESHSKLVVGIASRYRHAARVDFLDLVGAGHLGLHAAISRFDPDRFDTRLSAYAVSWIRWHIQDYLSRNAGPVRLPASSPYRQLQQIGLRLLAEARRSCERDGAEPSEAELHERVGRRIGLAADEVAACLRLVQGGSVSLHTSGTSATTAAPPLADTLADSNAASEDDVILRLDHAKARKRILALAEEILGERERAVFFARCMTDSDEVAHLAALAKELGVSPERVYQLEASAKRKIAIALAGEGYGELSRLGETIRLPTVRARRRRPAMVPLPKPVPIVAAAAAR